jgi:SAM-dependent methyltransferase
MDDDFVQYLEAKQSVDDRALNREVADSMKRFLRSHEGEVRILEVGAGHGATIERLASQGLLQQAAYTAIDPDDASLATARKRFRSDSRIGELELITANLYDFAASTPLTWDLVIAHAVLDLLDLDQAIPTLRSLCVPEGRFYFTINFDGETVFEPVIDPALDSKILALYHDTMDNRMVNGRLSGHSQTGRRLFGALAERGAVIEQSGSSDWVVWSSRGAYPNNEAHFLHFIVTTVEKALTGSTELDPELLHRWVEERHAQVDAGTLVYIAHQLDFFGRWPAAPTQYPPEPSRGRARES